MKIKQIKKIIKIPVLEEKPGSGAGAGIGAGPGPNNQKNQITNKKIKK